MVQHPQILRLACETSARSRAAVGGVPPPPCGRMKKRNSSHDNSTSSRRRSSLWRAVRNTLFAPSSHRGRYASVTAPSEHSAGMGICEQIHLAGDQCAHFAAQFIQRLCALHGYLRASAGDFRTLTVFDCRSAKKESSHAFHSSACCWSSVG